MKHGTYIAVWTSAGDQVSRIGRMFSAAPVVIDVSELSAIELAALRGEKGLLEVEECEPPVEPPPAEGENPTTEPTGSPEPAGMPETTATSGPSASAPPPPAPSAPRAANERGRRR